MKRAPRGVVDLDEADIVFDGRGVLEAEEDGRAAGFAGKAHVVAGQPVEDEVGVLFEAAVPRLDVQDGFVEILVVGDGDMNRVDAALAHLAEDLLGPVGVLQAVDAVGPCTGPGVLQGHVRVLLAVAGDLTV